MPIVAIVTDSIATIPDDMLQTLNIHWVPYYIHRGNEVLRDLVNITRQEFYRWLPFAKVLPKTANPGPGDYESLYEELAAEGTEEIISIHMSSKSSGAYQAATIAKETVLKETSSIKNRNYRYTQRLHVPWLDGD